MGEPQRQSRKGRMLSVLRVVRDLERDWRCYRGDWQPSAEQVRIARLKVARLRVAIDELDKALGTNIVE